MHDGLGWWMVLEVLWMSAFWGILIGATSWMTTRIMRAKRRKEGSGLEIARQRYARGEITQEEFHRICDDRHS